MLNILIQETDLFFRLGYRAFRRFLSITFIAPSLFTALTNENVSRADIIVLSLCQGNADLFSGITGPAKGIVIGLVDDELRFRRCLPAFRTLFFFLAGHRLIVLAAFCLLRGSRRNYRVTRNKRPVSTASIKGYPGNKFVFWSILPRAVGSADRSGAGDERKTVFTHKYMMMQNLICEAITS